MIVTITVGLIGALIVLGNYRHLRKRRVFYLTLFFTVLLALSGYYLLSRSEKAEKEIFLIFFSPLSSLLLLRLARFVLLKTRKLEIILYMRGLYPLRSEERYVSRSETFLTFLITALAVAIPYFLLMLA